MTDIFLSYAHEDAEPARRLAAALAGRGWTVFWDRTIPAGKTWRQVIGEALENARCVVVLWSEHSVTSDWVLEEADHARERKVLTPALIDDVRLPLGHGGLHAANLVAWKLGADNGGLDDLASAIAGRIGDPTQGVPTRNDRPPPSTPTVTEPARPMRVHDAEVLSIRVVSRWPRFALALLLLTIAGWVIAGPSIHHDMPGTNIFIVAIGTLGAFMAFPIRAPGAMLATFGMQGLNMFVMWVTVSRSLGTSRMDASATVFIVGIALLNALLVGLVCRWRLARSGGPDPEAIGGSRSAHQFLHAATVTLLLLLWTAYSATAFVSHYVWGVRDMGYGEEAVPVMMLGLGALWLGVVVVGAEVGRRALHAGFGEGALFGWGLAPASAALYFYNSASLLAGSGSADAYYSALIGVTNWGAFIVPLASAFGLWLFASTRAAPTAERIIQAAG